MIDPVKIALISAGSALGGVIISQFFSLLVSFLDKKHKKQQLLRQKYEEMLFHFSASLQWIVKVNSSSTQEDVMALSQSVDARKALSLCLLYFPELKDAANNYVKAQSQYYRSIATHYDRSNQFPAGAQAAVKDMQHQVVEKGLTDSKIFFENLIISTSYKYTKA